MASETYRWMKVDGFVVNCYTPSGTICVDESVGRWYGMGGTWINEGLPMYVSMDRKPEDGCEIQNSNDGNSTIMMRLKIVKSAKEES